MKVNWKIKAGIAVVILAGCAFGGWKYYQGQQAAKQQGCTQGQGQQRGPCETGYA